MENFIQEGRVIEITAGANYDSGDVVVIGERTGIACHDALNGETLRVQVEGCFTVPKGAVTTVVGEKLYWDVADGNVNKSSSGNIALGWATSVTATGATTVQAKLGAW